MPVNTTLFAQNPVPTILRQQFNGSQDLKMVVVVVIVVFAAIAVVIYIAVLAAFALVIFSAVYYC